MIQKYKLNMLPHAERTYRGYIPPKVNVSQYDKGLRTLVFDLYDGDQAYTLPENATAKIYGKKPDQNVFEYGMTIDASGEVPTVSIDLQEQMAVIAGCVECEVRILDGIDTAGSANFILAVEKAPVGADEVYSESEIPEIDNLLYGGTAGQVFTKTPTGAHWADLGTSSDFMLKSEYDPNDDGSVLKADHADDADTVDGHTVARNVLADEYTNSQIDTAVQAVSDAVSQLDGEVVKNVNNVAPVAGNVTMTKADIGLGNVDNTSDADKPISTATQAALDGKVDKVTGKGLSTNDFTTAEKEKLAGIAAGAEVNVQANWNESDHTSDAFIQNKPSIPSKTSDLTNDSGFVTDAAMQSALDQKVDKVAGKGLSAEDFTSAEKTKLQGIEAGAQVNTVLGVKGGDESVYRTGNVNITKTNIGLGNVDNTSDLDKPISTATQAALDQKQATLTFDTTPTAGSTNPVTSGGIATEISAINTNLSFLEDEIDSIGTATSIEDTEPYLFRQSARENVVGNIMSVHKIIGGTVAWNQLVHITTDKAEVGVTFTDNQNGSITANGTATANSYIRCSDFDVGIVGHVYCISGGAGSVKCWFNGTPYIKSEKSVFKVTATGAFYIRVDSGETASNVTVWPQVYDLTQMFGSTIADYIYSLDQANAGAGVAFFRNLFPNDYYAYNAGELISVKTSAHVMRGFNQWDEKIKSNYQIGGDGVETYVNNRWCTEGYIPVLPNTSYYLRSPIYLNARWYDADKNYIGYSVIGANSAFTPSNVFANARFLRFNGYDETYNNDICINLSKTTGSPKNGDYVPYEKHSYPLDPDLELRGIPKLDSNNNLYYDGDEYEPSGTVTRKYGIVDLGTLNWFKTWYTEQEGYRIYATVSGKAASLSNMICGKYRNANAADGSMGDNTITGNNANNIIYIKDSSFASSGAQSLINSLSGVYLVYELTTPTTETADAYDKQQVFDVTGTEEYVDTRSVPIPVGHDTFFLTSLTSRIDALEDEVNEEITSISESIAPIETSPATATHATGTYIMYQNRLYKVIASIAVGETLTVGTNIQATTIMAELLSLTA